MHIVAILMTIIMILHIRSKYTAVGTSRSTTNSLNVVATDPEAYTGRKEIVTFFYLYAVIEILAFFMDSGVIPSAHASYAVRDLMMLLKRNTFDAECDVFSTSGSLQSIPGWWQRRTPVC